MYQLIEGWLDQLHVVKSNGDLAKFDKQKIAGAVIKAVFATAGKTGDDTIKSKENIDKAYDVADRVVERIASKEEVWVNGILSIARETIQDVVEFVLSKVDDSSEEAPYSLIAKEYIVYRSQRDSKKRNTTIITHEGRKVSIESIIENKYIPLIKDLSKDLPHVDIERVINKVITDAMLEMSEEDLEKTFSITIRNYIEEEPEYDRLLANYSRHFADQEVEKTIEEILDEYGHEPTGNQLCDYILAGIAIDQLLKTHNGKTLFDFYDIEKLNSVIDHGRSDKIKYLGFQTLYDRYFLKTPDGRRFENFQLLCMRVAMALAANEEKPTERAIEFYDSLSTTDYMTSTPTLFNAGLKRQQLSSCYLTTIPDDLSGIYGAMHDNALLSKFAGGLGNDWTPVRGLGSYIKGTNGESQGVVPFMKVANDTAVAVNQCFAPETKIYTSDGIKCIKDIVEGDLVLGISGHYREVTEVMEYDQPEEDPMLSIYFYYGNDKEIVTSGHPFYVASGDKVGWVEAGDIKAGSDFVAKVIPTEIILFQDDSTVGNLDNIAKGFGEGAFFGDDLPISSRHLPLRLTEKVIEGFLSKAVEEDAFSYSPTHVLVWSKESAGLYGIQYQLLRLGIHSSVMDFPPKGYSIAIPLVDIVANALGKDPIASDDFYVKDGKLFVRVGYIAKNAGVPKVYDLKVEGDESYMLTTALAHNGGKRKGAVCAYLETWHIDVEEFLELRKNTGDDRRRTHDMNTANWVPDLFMKRVQNEGEWTLFSPDEVPDLHDLYGEDFELRYEEYEARIANGEKFHHKKVSAVKLWRKMLGMLFETGHPWITFKDPCNYRSPQRHVGVVHSSNLCTEITLNTKANEEIAVCNLGSVNLVNHIDENGNIDKVKLRKTILTAIRMLDNVIDINYYAVPTAEHSNQKHRPIGLGVMGFQDVLYIKDISYSSQEAIDFSEELQEMIALYAIEASALLAAEKGVYCSYKGSLWEQGIMPIDSAIHYKESRKGFEQMVIKSNPYSKEWNRIRALVARNGMRNSNVMAIAPTATIANIVGVSASIEPTYQNLYVKSNLSGDFTVINEYLVNDLKELGVWNEETIADLKFSEGSLNKYPDLFRNVPQRIKDKYMTAFENEPELLVECAARRQIHIDQAQSLNIYIAGASGKKLHDVYMKAWMSGCKTTYYLRALGATSTEKSTVTRTTHNAVSNQTAVSVQPAPVPLACSIDDPDCEACQ